MKKSHAAGWGEHAPSPAQLKELFAQIQTGRVTGPRLQTFLKKEWPATIREAREILGSSRFFGPDEWKEFFGEEFPPSKIPEIPWFKKDLQDDRFLPQGQFLCLVPGSLRKQPPIPIPLTLSRWNNVVFKQRPVRFHMDTLLVQEFAQVYTDTRWILMPVGPLESSRGLAYEDQAATLPSGYEVASTFDRVTANVLYYMIHPDLDWPKFLDNNDCWARTRDVTDDGKHICVVGRHDFGLSISKWCKDSEEVVIAVSRKI